MTQEIIGKKLGMSQIFGADGRLAAITAIEAGPCTVAQVKTTTRDGYNAVQLGFGEAKRPRSSPRAPRPGVGRFQYLREFRQADTKGLKVGQKIDAGLFQTGDLVDVTGLSKGKGFAGVVKRHHFAGGPKTHGQSDRHRAPGSIGAGTSPGRVFKGTLMAGHMGNQRVTTRHLKVLQADPNRNLLLIRGAVPGSRNGWLLIKKSNREK